MKKLHEKRKQIETDLLNTINNLMIRGRWMVTGLKKSKDSSIVIRPYKKAIEECENLIKDIKKNVESVEKQIEKQIRKDKYEINEK